VPIATNEADDDGDVVCTGELTRDERDEIGYRNAIELSDDDDEDLSKVLDESIPIRQRIDAAGNFVARG
jgi:hypothetical protein